MEGVESAGGSEEPGQGRSSVNTNGTNVAVTNVGLPSILPTNNSNNNASAFMSWREHRDRDPLAALGAGEAAVGVGGFFDPHSPQSNSDDSEMEDAESLSSGHRRMSMSTSITSAGGYSGALALQNTQTMGGSGGTMPMMLSSRSSDARRLNRPQPYPISGADSLGGSPYRGNGIVLGSPGRWVPPPVTVHPGQWNRMHVVPLTSASNSNSISAGSTNNGFDTPGRNRSHSFSGGDVSMDVARRERSGSSSNSSGAAAPPLLPLIGPGGSGPSLSGSGSVSAGFAGTGGHGAPSIVPPHTPAHNRSKSMSLPSAPTGLHDHPALGSGSLGGGSGGVGATPLAKKNRISALLHEDTPEHEIEHERGVTWLLKRQLGMLGVSPAGGEELPLPPHTPVRRASEGGMLPSISAIAAATSRREFVPLAPPTSDPSLDSHDDAASDRLNSVPPSDTFTSHEEDETASMLSVSMSQEPLTPRSETRGEELNLASGSRSIPRRRESFMVDVEGEELLDVPVYSSGQAYAVRMSPIPNSQLKMPLNYVSKTSKLNPENSYYRQTPVFSVPLPPNDEAPLSPSMLPNPHVARVMEPPSGKRKRAASEVSDESPSVNNGKRYEPYAKRHHRSYSGSWDKMVPGSPSSGAAMVLGSPVSAHMRMPELPTLLGSQPSQSSLQQSQQSLSMESQPSASATSNNSNSNSNSNAMLLQSPRLIPQITTYGGVGAMLNLTEAQELASKWSIGSQRGRMEEDE